MTSAEALAAAVASALRLTECRPTAVLSERPGVALVLALRTDAGRLVARWSPSPVAVARAAAAHAALSGVRRTGRGDLSVPRVLLHDADAGILVTEHVAGTSLAALLAAGDLRELRRFGAGLARLHGTDVRIGPDTRLAGHVVELTRPHPRALDQDDHLQARANDVLDALLRAEPHDAPSRPVHRDLHPRQVLVGVRRGWLLDWEFAATGDPALDVGNFCGYLRARLEPRRAHAAVAAFRDGYSIGDDTGALGRSSLYEAFTYLRLACKRSRLGGVAARRDVATLLHAAEACLAGRAPSAREADHAVA